MANNMAGERPGVGCVGSNVGDASMDRAEMAIGAVGNTNVPIVDVGRSSKLLQSFQFVRGWSY